MSDSLLFQMDPNNRLRRMTACIFCLSVLQAARATTETEH